MLAAGTTLGPYKILAPLGAGGMGEVYRARDTRLGRDVALKVIHAEVAGDPDRIKRFEQEARAAGAVSHPNVCAIHDIGTHDGSPFVVMELLEGESLREKLRTGPIPARKAIDYAAQAAHGLAAAHEKGIVHRDLKPENLFVTKDGRVKVLDFGLAKLTRPDVVAAAGEPTVSIAATETGAILGTVGYMSPEQVRGQVADARSDLFALGAILYEMVTGRRAFHGETYVETLGAILKEDPPPLAEAGQAIPPNLEPLVRRCLEKSPDERFQNARDLAFDLESIGSGQMAGAPVTAPSIRHRRRFAWAVAAAAIVLVGVGVWLAWGPLSRWLGGQHTTQPTKKDWILVAEFDGPPDDSTLASAARSLVSAALDQSEIVATVPRDQIQLALQQAGKPTNTRVSAEVARELAYRRAVRAVLEGDIQRIGRGYSVVLRVVDAESLKVVLTERGSAKDEDALIPALGKMAEKLREGLGERRSAVAATRPMTTGVTPSFEAYRLFVEATGLFRSGDMDGAIALYDAALRLDPGFCMAWFNLALAESNMGRVDSVQVAYEQAGRTSERLTATGRLRLEATRTLEGGDLERALAMYSGLVQMNPGDIFALSQTANILTSLGRFEEALARTQECERRSAFGATTVMLINEVEFMLNLGRVEAARERVSRIVGISAAGMRSEVELAACNWATAESIAAAQTQDLGIGTPRRLWALARLASAKGGRGSLRAADATLRQLGQVAGRDWLDGRVQAWRARLFLADETRGAIELPSDSWADDTSTAVLLLRGMRAAQAGDQAAAARLLKAAQTRSARELAEQGAAPQLLEARVKALAGRWEEAVDILQPIGGQTIEVGPVRYGAGLPAVRCLLADAFVKLGRPDSAAVYLERTTTDVAFLMSWTGISVPLAHQRLVLLYTRMGRLADAERHLAILERWWDKPDDIARRMLEDARAAVASARSMARPERPRT